MLSQFELFDKQANLIRAMSEREIISGYTLALISMQDYTVFGDVLQHELLC